ncbi:MAG: hypothetical protein F9K30_23125 [Dechloromonas sp.]|nr:MAG: hypothetical protein F9K30_23125 [Dechloromonas sp.]
MKSAAIAITILAGMAWAPATMAQYATIDQMNIAQASKIAAEVARQSGILDGIQRQATKISSQIGIPLPNIVDLAIESAAMKRWTWYNPSARSTELKQVPGLDWSNPDAAVRSTGALYYTRSQNPTEEEKARLLSRRRTGLQDAAQNLHAMAQLYRDTLTQQKAEVELAASQLNGGNLASQVQLQNKLLLALYRQQVAANNMVAAQSELQAMHAILADGYVTGSR